MLAFHCVVTVATLSMLFVDPQVSVKKQFIETHTGKWFPKSFAIPQRNRLRQEASSGGAQSAALAPAPVPVPVPAVEVVQLLLRKPDLFKK